MGLRTGLAIAAILACGPALALEVTGTQFQLTVTRDGVETNYPTTTIPLLPDEACYYWWVQVDSTEETLDYVETLHIPKAAADWGDDPTDLDVSEDGRTIERGETATLDEGWFGGGWCVLAGDPIGQHSIDVAVDGTVIHTFYYVVVRPEAFGLGPDQRALLERKR